MRAALHARLVGLHQRGDLGDGGGGEEGFLEGGRVFGEVAGHAGDVDEAGGGFQEGVQGLADFEGSVVVGFDGFFDDGVVWKSLVRVRDMSLAEAVGPGMGEGRGMKRERVGD